MLLIPGARLCVSSLRLMTAVTIAHPGHGFAAGAAADAQGPPLSLDALRPLGALHRRSDLRASSAVEPGNEPTNVTVPGVPSLNVHGDAGGSRSVGMSARKRKNATARLIVDASCPAVSLLAFLPVRVML
jgi:hypothetical protein